MKHLKLFNDTASYEAWKNSEDYVLPNVTFTEDGNLYYNAYVEPVSPNIVCRYNVTDISYETKILHDYALGSFSSMIVDGVEMDVDCYYQFDTTGLHTVEFVYAEGTYRGYNLNEVIGEGWFRLAWADGAWVSLEIPASVKFVHSSQSIEGENLKEIIFHSAECPLAYGGWNNNTFHNLAETGVLKYPKGSDYSLVIECMAQYHPGWTCVEF